ncbi:TetR/AcrR family transcriptional regulator [Mycolicibacterium litorale]|uniref:TetR family transcriptional regulator n=1 Tax=Mycolicibacterium litorale TaxID=758802 RepID=A0AAD1IHZ5_9MYCO|nr:TetR/AcrR family transcriptional regulator [Mycolicibacterium litorale]MCV7414162.1 TetR/AcrR family transcriptional regulator [Mycolicibacterium litorale]TDY02146.1 TetR family transcriptional regulator [Mycolicibacterium litorale]BBY15650.1 TetR family transcriptional regulator [Mycolicibacterium litorale]
MANPDDRRPRADAARNVERILRAARAVYAELGPDAALDVVARHAGVGERTLYRHFPNKGDLVRAALEQAIAEDLTPVIDEARRAKDPLRGLTRLIEAAIALGAREHHILAAARRAGSLTDDVPAPLYDTLTDLTERAQRQGLVRADLVAAHDLPRIIAMLNSVLWTMDLPGDGWRRYVALIVDGISTTPPRRLPRVVPLRFEPRSDVWPG